jgi:hypothetical protein
MVGEVHILLKGPKKDSKIDELVRLFHFIIGSTDPDWPYTNSWSYPMSKLKVCAECGGRVYNNPRMSPSEIKAFIRQLHVPIKIVRYANASRCAKNGKEPMYGTLKRDGTVMPGLINSTGTSIVPFSAP